MNAQHVRDNDRLRDKLAAEYVLGTLRGGARRRFEVWISEEAVVRQAVTQWENRLHPLAEMTGPVSPPPRIWQNIAGSLELGDTAAPSGKPLPRPGWRDSLRFWRGLGLISTAAAVLVALLLVREPESESFSPAYVAALTDKQSQVAMVVTGDARRRQLTVKLVSVPRPAPDKSLELWALPKGDAPRSLGLVSAENPVTLTLPENALSGEVGALAISLEPKGGSPNPRAPTGPILYTGPWLRI